MRSIYYLEVNIICVIFLMFINKKTSANKKKTPLVDKIFKYSVLSSGIMCITDALMALIDFKLFPCSIMLNHILNMIYFACGTFTAYGWLLFVSLSAGIGSSKKIMILMGIPFLLILFLIIINPFTNFMFLINEKNVYCRGPLLFLQWVSILFYISCATIFSILAAKKENNKVVRKIYLSYIGFGIFPLVGFSLQVIVSGITTTTVGVALGYLFFYIKSLENQISEDSLTGLNNRKQLDRYVNDLIFHGSDNQIFIMAMDLNGFKLINDSYGHTTGDLALKDFADALRMACRHWRGHYMLCRYGGDEFAIVGEYFPDSDLGVFVSLIRENVEKITGPRKRPYSLTTSIGVSKGICRKTEDFTQLYKEADKKMYEDKLRQKKS